MEEKIKELKKKKNAIIVAHNYQLPEVQRVADFIGDSLELAKLCTDIEQDIIVFAGVRFMAEIAKILNPNKKVLIPSLQAECEMAKYLNPEIIRKYKKIYPDSEVVLYVNSSTECKAEATVLVTSSNAVKIVNKLEKDIILFGPDANLARYVQKHTDKKIIPIPDNGHCYVHTSFDPEYIPDGFKIAHPECPEEIQNISDHIASTGGMIRFVKDSDNKRFVLLTEREMTYRLKSLYPDKEFIPGWDNAICLGMKNITLEKIYRSLMEERYEITLPDSIIERAMKPLRRMLELS